MAVETTTVYPSSVTIKEQEHGTHVGLDIHFFRHGKKTQDGLLHPDAVQEAERLGEVLGQPTLAAHESIEIFSGSLDRVRDTAAAIARGWSRVRKDDERVEPQVWDLLSHTTFLLDKGSSEYFRRVNQRLESAYGHNPLIREELLRRIEKRNMQEWIDSDGERPDTGTASPWEVAQHVVSIINTCLDKTATIPQHGHKDVVLVTHEYVVAAVVRYLLASAGYNAKNGAEIFSALERIDYLEEVTISVRSDAYGEKTMFATLRGENYFIQLDQRPTT